MQNSREFYEGRIRFIMNQNKFEQREQLLGCVVSAAICDRSLTVSDQLAVLAQVEAAHQKSLEVNYNEGWN